MYTTPGTSEYTSNMIIGFLMFVPFLVYAFFHIRRTEREAREQERERLAKYQRQERQAEIKREQLSVRDEFLRVMDAINYINADGFITGKHSSRWKTAQNIRIKFAPKYAQTLGDHRSNIRGFFNIDYDPQSTSSPFTFDYDYKFERFGRVRRDIFERASKGKSTRELCSALTELKDGIAELLADAQEIEELDSQTSDIRQVYENCELWTSATENAFDAFFYDPFSGSQREISVTVLEMGFMDIDGRHPDFLICAHRDSGIIYKNTVDNLKTLTDLSSGEKALSAIAIRKLLLKYCGLRVEPPGNTYDPSETRI